MRKFLIILTFFHLNFAIGQIGWQELGEGTNALNTVNDIDAITKDKQGNIYVATKNDNIITRYSCIVKWNGNSWTELKGGVNITTTQPFNQVIADSFGNIYATASSYKNANNFQYLFKWNGSIWSEIGTTTNGLKMLHISSSCADNKGNIYAAGYDNAGKYFISKWDGINWINMTNMAIGIDKILFITSISADASGSLIVAGKFAKTPNDTFHIAKLASLNWVKLADKNIVARAGKLQIDKYNNIYLYNLYDSNNKEYVAKYNGITWATLRSATNDTTTIFGTSLSVDNNMNVYVTAKKGTQQYVAKWDGIKWQELGLDNCILLNANGEISSIYSDDLNVYVGGSFIGGEYDSNLGRQRQYLAKWNGRVWDGVGGSLSINASANYAAGNRPHSIEKVVVDKNGKVYAMGAGIGGNPRGYTSTYGYNVVFWDGVQWNILGENCYTLNANATINTMIIDSSNNIYVAGKFKNLNNRHYVAKWDGSNWTELGTGSNSLGANNEITSLAIDKNQNVYAIGKFSDHPSYSYNGNQYIAKWNGNTWSKVTNIARTQYNDPPGYLFVDANNSIYTTTHPDNWGSSIVGINKWDGFSWTAIGNTRTGSMPIAADKQNNIYTGARNGADYYVVKYNGTTWTQVGSEFFNGKISSLVIDANNNIYIAGNFKNASGYYYVAKWDGLNWIEYTGTNNLAADKTIYTLAYDNVKNIAYCAGDFTKNNKCYVATFSNFILPLKLISFTANNQLGKVILNWQTTNEINVSHFKIEGSTDGINFNIIGKVNAINKIENSYSFIDENVESGMNYYRIVGIDKDGKTTYSQVKSLNIKNLTSNTTIYPNPAKDILNVFAKNIETISLTSLDGKLLLQTSSKQININGLEKGLYLIRVKTKTSCKVYKIFKE